MLFLNEEEVLVKDNIWDNLIPSKKTFVENITARDNDFSGRIISSDYPDLTFGLYRGSVNNIHAREFSYEAIDNLSIVCWKCKDDYISKRNLLYLLQLVTAAAVLSICELFLSLRVLSVSTHLLLNSTSCSTLPHLKDLLP